MASTMVPEELGSELIVRQADSGDINPAVSMPQSKDNDEAWFDMADCESVLVVARLTARTANISSFVIEASAASNGDTPSTIKTHAAPTVADAAGDYLVLEVKAEELEDVLAGLRYIAAKVGCADNADRVTVTYVGKAKRKVRALTTNYPEA